MTNHPEAALRALPAKWRKAVQCAREGADTTPLATDCADDLDELLRQIEAAPSESRCEISGHCKLNGCVHTTFGLPTWKEGENPFKTSPPDSSQGEPDMSLRVALDFADNPRPYHTLQAPADTNGELYEALRVIAKAYRTTPPPSSPQVADGYAIVPIECPPSVAACIPEHGYPAGCKVYTDAIKHAALHVPWLRVSAYSCAHEAGGARLCNEWCRDEKTCPASYSFAAPQSAPKAADPVEPQARHWREAIATQAAISEEWDEFTVEQRARSLAQAEQAK